MPRIPITPEDQKRALVRGIINTPPVVKITPGMWQHLDSLRRRRPWWRRLFRR